METDNENLKILIDKLYSDKDILYKFIQNKSEDELYKYALTIVGGYTKEEFIGALNHVIKESEISYRNESFSESHNLSDRASGKISSGAGIRVRSMDELFKSFVSSVDLVKKGWDFGSLLKRIVDKIKNR